MLVETIYSDVEFGSPLPFLDVLLTIIVATIRVEPSVLVFLAFISKSVNIQPIHFWKDLETIFEKIYWL